VKVVVVGVVETAVAVAVFEVAVVVVLVSVEVLDVSDVVVLVAVDVTDVMVVVVLVAVAVIDVAVVVVLVAVAVTDVAVVVVLVAVAVTDVTVVVVLVAVAVVDVTVVVVLVAVAVIDVAVVVVLVEMAVLEIEVAVVLMTVLVAMLLVSVPVAASHIPHKNGHKLVMLIPKPGRLHKSAVKSKQESGSLSTAHARSPDTVDASTVVVAAVVAPPHTPHKIGHKLVMLSPKPGRLHESAVKSKQNSGSLSTAHAGSSDGVDASTVVVAAVVAPPHTPHKIGHKLVMLSPKPGRLHESAVKSKQNSGSLSTAHARSSDGVDASTVVVAAAQLAS
jgi:hypothetical protein